MKTAESVEIKGLTVQAAAARWQVSPSLIRKAIREKKLRVYRVSRRIVVPVEILDSWIRSKSTTA